MTYNEIWRRLLDVYDDAEAKAVTRLLLESGFGMNFTDVVCGGVERLDAEDVERLQVMISRLMKNEPLQYVLSEAEFGGRIFHVRSGCLIPRPETEELCGWIVDDYRQQYEPGKKTRLLDVGTGSGCIAITLALDMEDAEVTAWDISDETIAIAAENAERLGADVNFEKCDALNVMSGGDWDIIVSNPPYICDNERTGMARNVLDYEPHTALFVPDSAPLLFYSAITKYAATSLNKGGGLYFELNHLYAEDTRDMMLGMGFADVEIKNDQFGKPRFARGIK